MIGNTNVPADGKQSGKYFHIRPNRAKSAGMKALAKLPSSDRVVRLLESRSVIVLALNGLRMLAGIAVCYYHPQFPVLWFLTLVCAFDFHSISLPY